MKLRKRAAAVASVYTHPAVLPTVLSLVTNRVTDAVITRLLDAPVFPDNKPLSVRFFDFLALRCEVNLLHCVTSRYIARKSRMLRESPRNLLSSFAKYQQYLT